MTARNKTTRKVKHSTTPTTPAIVQEIKAIPDLQSTPCAGL